MRRNEITRPAQRPDHMRELLFSAIGTQDLIEAEQISFVRLALKLVGIPGEP
jgi:hypothetical protein